jgi:hypothetical protein
MRRPKKAMKSKKAKKRAAPARKKGMKKAAKRKMPAKKSAAKRKPKAAPAPAESSILPSLSSFFGGGKTENT